MTLLRETKSVCPECFEVIKADIVEENGKVLIKKECPEHGSFEDIYWGDSSFYKKAEKYAFDGGGVSNPQVETANCPDDCGLCSLHKTQSNLANIDVTNRCNQRCPICFANAATAGYIYEPSVEQIKNMLTVLKNQKPVRCWAVQFAGGEPTVREDLPELVKMAKEFGFTQVQVATNGIKIAQDVNYIKKLRENGLNIVYLQFDSLKSEPYKIARGYDALQNKLTAVENCKKADTGVILVPTVVKGVNSGELGDIIKYAAKLDVVKGVNFQPVSFTGRINKQKLKEERITIPDVLKLVEEQTDGQITRDSWYSIPSVVPISKYIEAITGKPIIEFTPHFACGMATYVFYENGKFIPITDFIDFEGLREYLIEETEKMENSLIKNSSIKKLNAVKLFLQIEKFFDKEKAPSNITSLKKLLANVLLKKSYESLGDFHTKSNAIFLGIMHFQDAYNMDLERLKRCCIHYVVPDGRVIPFCAYNGLQHLYRTKIEKELSIPVEEWEKKTSKKLKDDFYVPE